VTKVRIRATTIRDWNRKELLVPNKDLITGQVLNWSLSDEMLRISIVVGVAYGTDVSKALALMKEAAEEDEHVLTNPAPLLSFDSFGDNALTLTLRAYLTHIDYLIQATTDLHSAIMHKFEAASIEIAFPQRDVHLDTLGPLRVHIEKAPQQNLKGNDLE
jgi:potassium efflux system protein